ncbi:MAG: class I tRNA ligase family protein, partial [Candidatus Aenigmarchaeota archaeon]|nr:class I tRNA ligase family protein [Candidatus Aenigmarchaeota archaeon]
SKTMLGHDVDFVPGWDCHGLPIEHKVLKELGDEAKDLSKLKIRYKCQSYAEKYVKLQSRQMQRLGTIGDYDNPYLTMTPDYEAGVLEVFS